MLSVPSRLSRYLVPVALPVFGIVAALLLVEGGFWVYYWLRPVVRPGFFWEPHPDYGWRLIPKRKGFFWTQPEEFRVWVEISSKGLRDVEHAYGKPPGSFRILVLGDSYMEALQVPLEQTFARRLESELEARGAVNVEVINSGVASYGTDNEYLYLTYEGYKYRPDLVLLAFTTANDVRESYPPLNRRAARANVNKPQFELGPDGALKSKPGPPVQRLPWWKRTYVGQQLVLALGGQLWPSQPTGDRPPRDPSIPWVPTDMLVFANNYPPEVLEAWKLTKRLVLAIRDKTESLRARFAVMVVNGPWAHYDDAWMRMTARHPLGQKTWDRQRPNRVLRPFLSENGIPFVDLFEPFEKAKNEERLFFRFDPHWTPAGHQLAAQVVAEFLIAQGLVPVVGPEGSP